MKSRTITGALAAALLTTAVATPADAQRYRRHDDRRGDGISLSDVVLGTIIVGGVATAIGALSSGRRYDDRYRGRSRGYGYGDDRQASVEACAYEAEREIGRRYGGQGQVRDIDVDRGRDGYRVRGTVEVRSDYRYGRDGYGRGYDRDAYDRNGRVRFSCDAYAGRVTGLSMGSNYVSGY